MKLKDFTGEARLVDIKDKELITELQARLGVAADGIVGAGTLAAFAKFKKEAFLTKPDVLGASTATLLSARNNYVIRKEQAEAVFGRKITERQFLDLNYCLTIFQINTIKRVKHFLSQVGHESAGLRYSTELASGAAYEWRKDLGNVRAGDGRLFKGGGYLQLTGRANYQLLANAVQDPKVMTGGAVYVGSVYPFTSAGVWWQKNRMNALIDGGAGVLQVTKRVNGGTNGLADRQHYYDKATQVFG